MEGTDKYVLTEFESINKINTINKGSTNIFTPTLAKPEREAK